MVWSWATRRHPAARIVRIQRLRTGDFLVIFQHGQSMNVDHALLSDRCRFAMHVEEFTGCHPDRLPHTDEAWRRLVDKLVCRSQPKRPGHRCWHWLTSLFRRP